MHPTVMGLGLASLLVGAEARGASPCEYTPLVALPHAPGMTNSDAWSVNESGTIVGQSGWILHLEDEEFGPYTQPVAAPARWVGGRVESLDGPLVTVIGGQTVEVPFYEAGEGETLQKEFRAYGWAVGVNASGVIAGDLFFEGEQGGGRRAAVWDDAARKWRALPTRPGRPNSGARGINDEGDVVGGNGGPVVWRNGEIHVLPLAEGAYGCSTFAINNPGDVAGQCFFAIDDDFDAVWAVSWQGDSATVYDGPGWGDFARAISDPGKVVGHQPVADWQENAPWPGSALAWAAGGTTGVELAYPGSANGVNNRGDVVGYAGVNGGTSQAALWTRKGAENLFPPLCGHDRAWFRDINNPGVMVGFSGVGDTSTAVYARRP